MKKTLLLATTLAFTALASAQTATTPAKKELVAKILQAQQPAVETLARQLVEQPAAQMMQRAGLYIQQRVAADKREAMARDVQAEVRKYVEETYPLVRDRAVKLAPSTVGVVLEERLTEDELRQVVAVFASPTWQKFQALGNDMQRSLGEKLVAEVKGDVETRMRALDRTLGKRLGLPQPASGPSNGK